MDCLDTTDVLCQINYKMIAKPLTYFIRKLLPNKNILWTDNFQQSFTLKNRLVTEPVLNPDFFDWSVTTKLLSKLN